tara:strand:- start:260 stop:436 length:177 start_codon:yes stop_codon:yes gene_type:complete
MGKVKSKKVFVKQVLNDNTPNTPMQYDVKGSVEKSKKVKQTEVFDFDKKYNLRNKKKK